MSVQKKNKKIKILHFHVTELVVINLAVKGLKNLTLSGNH